MAARFWVTGGTGNWNSTTNWSATTGGASGASVPSTADTAAFDASSGSGTATLDISPTVQTLTMTGFTGTLAFGTNTISLNSTGTIFTGSTTTTVTGTPLIICTNSSATARTISPGIVTEANSISFNITAGTGTVTLTTNHSFKNVDYTGFTGILGSGSPVLFGNLTLDPSMSVTAGGTVFFQSTSGTKTITTNAVVVDKSFNFNGVGGTWQLQDALTSGATRTTTLTNGTLNLNNYTLTMGIFSSSNSNTRTLAFGTGKIVATGTNVTVVTFATSTGLSYTGTSKIEVSGSGISGETRIINGANVGGTEANAQNIYVTTGGDTVTLGTISRVYGTLDFTGFTGTLGTAALTATDFTCYGNFKLSSGMSVTSGTGPFVFAASSGTKTVDTDMLTTDVNVQFNGDATWAMQNALTLPSKALTLINGTLQLKSGTTSTVGSFVTTGTNVKYLQATTPGSQATISDASGTNSVSYLTIQDSNATGGATFYATDPTNVNAGNNTGWIFFPTPADSNEITMRLRSFTQPRRF